MFLFLHSACVPHEEEPLSATGLLTGFSNRIAFFRGLGGQGSGKGEGEKDLIVGSSEIGGNFIW